VYFCGYQSIKLFIMTSIKYFLLIMSGIVFFSGQSFSQNDLKADTTEGFVFRDLASVEVSPVKDQNRSGTCWSFAAVSFIEAELLRSTEKLYDISEMFFVRYAYEAKAERYVRYHGKANFGGGGQAHDVINVVKEKGLLMESDYPGLKPDEENHNHSEMDAVLSGYIEALVKNKSRNISNVWKKAFSGILDAYLGEVPQEIHLNGEMVPLKKVAEMIGFNPDDYVEITSYTHHPFYELLNLEIPDNWSADLYYNVPLDELMEICRYALENDYTVCWDGDVSDKGFSFRNGLALVPDDNPKNLTDTEMSKWEELTEEEKMKTLYDFKEARQEIAVGQDLRQQHFNSFKATDDHLMHLTGLSQDQNGTLYYMTKNSWADDSNDFGGYLRMSDAYLRLNTVAIMVHKDAIPPKIAKKLEIY